MLAVSYPLLPARPKNRHLPPPPLCFTYTYPHAPTDKHVEELFHKLLESLNFYKRKAGSLEIEVQQLKDARARLEERIKSLQEETKGWEAKTEEHEKRKEGKAINKVRKLIWSASVRRRATADSSIAPPIPAMVEAK